MAWFLLFLAGMFEIGWAVGLKYTDGFTRPVPTILTVISMVIRVFTARPSSTTLMTVEMTVRMVGTGPGEPSALP